MALVVKDRVKETTTTVGTGAYALAGAVTGYQSFSVIGSANYTFYCTTDGVDWEVGLGLYSGTTLSRTSIFDSSNAGAAVNWGAGSKDIFVTYPANNSIYTDGAIISTGGATGVLGLVNGGTGQTTANDALNALLPSQGGSGGKYLKTNGTNTLWDTSPVGQLYVENPSSPTAPTATGTNAVAIGNASTASATESVALAGGAVGASDTRSVAIGFSASASGFGQNIAIFATNSGGDSTAIGRNSSGGGASVVSGGGVVALSGSRASGSDSFAAAISTNTSTTGAGAASAVAIGLNAYAQFQRDLAIGGELNVAQGGTSTVVGGSNNTASGTLSFIIGGSGNTTGQLYSGAIGFQANAAIYGKFAHASGRFSTTGDAQYGRFILRRGTTDATPVVLTANNNAPGATNQIILPNNSAFAFTGTIVARQQAAGGSDYAAWEIKGGIIRDANAAATTLGAHNVNRLSATAGASAWAVALSADTTNGGLAITVTGAVSTNIRWVATVHTSELTYA